MHGPTASASVTMQNFVDILKQNQPVPAVASQLVVQLKVKDELIAKLSAAQLESSNDRAKMAEEREKKAMERAKEAEKRHLHLQLRVERERQVAKEMDMKKFLAKSFLDCVTQNKDAASAARELGEAVNSLSACNFSWEPGQSPFIRSMLVLHGSFICGSDVAAFLTTNVHAHTLLYTCTCIVLICLQQNLDNKEFLNVCSRRSMYASRRSMLCILLI